MTGQLALDTPDDVAALRAEVQAWREMVDLLVRTYFGPKPQPPGTFRAFCRAQEMLAEVRP